MLVFSNVHEREYPVPAAKLSNLLDSIAGAEDRLWPTGWPPIRFDRELGPGARGGHDPIRYDVAAYEPGQWLEFRFDPNQGLSGTHRLEIRPGEPDGMTVLRHILLVRSTSGRMRLLFPLAFRHLHDALIEDLLERAAVETGTPSPHPPRWSPYVRLLRAMLK